MTGQLPASHVGITGKNVPRLFVPREGKHPLAAIRLRRGAAGVKDFPVAAPCGCGLRAGWGGARRMYDRMNNAGQLKL